MAQSSARRSPRQNPLFDNKDKLADGTPTYGNERRTPVFVATRPPIPAVAPVIPPLVAFGFVNSSVVKYLEDDLQRIVKTILEARPFFSFTHAPVLTLVVTTAPHYEGLRERPLQAKFPNVY